MHYFVLNCALLTLTQMPTDPLLRDLPAGWRIESNLEVAAAQRQAIGEKLGGKIEALANVTLSANGKRVKVNTLVAGNEGDARRLEQALLRGKSNSRLVQRNGHTVREIVCDDIRLALDARYRLGIQPKRVTYRVAFAAAPLEEAEYMEWNRLYNLFLERDKSTAAQVGAVDRRIGELAAKFTFGERLRLRRHGQGTEESTYSFSLPGKSGAAPMVTGDAQAESEDTREFRFAKLSSKAGVPVVSCVAEITSETYASVRSAGRRDEQPLLAPTAFWPSEDDGIVRLAAEITRGKGAREAKVQAILDYLLPGKNIRYDGEVVGSRYGVSKVLRQKYGRCWDLSDVFVTLCRASGVPCRQVGGWLAGVSGHVWAEYVDEDGVWRQVDPSAGMACGSDYVPWVSSDDGSWPLVYASAVTVEVIAR